jgi:uncharacterized cofD-like protein
VRPFEKKLSAFKWLYPGMKVKRWLVLLLVGTTVLALGFAYLLRSIYDTWTFPSSVYYLTLQFVPREWRAMLFGLAGLAAVVLAVIQLNRSLLAVFVTPGNDKVVDVIYRHRIQAVRGPKIVVIGGGTGLSTLLRGLKEYSTDISAIVTVADDGGSSGRIREDFGMLPPGDFRDCIVALADDESMVARLFQYRFAGDRELGGHSFGNLFIAAMVGVTGNFERAILESSRVLAVRGRILPSTLDNVTLCAEVLTKDGDDRIRNVEGESQIPRTGGVIQRVYLRPDGALAYPGALRAILSADLVAIGPGSLYTSIIPNLLIGEIVDAIRVSPALKLYICNAATQIGETDNFSVEDHVDVLQRYVGDVFLHVLSNNNFDVEVAGDRALALVFMRNPTVTKSKYHSIEKADVIDPENPWRHDSVKLAENVMKLYESLKADLAA